MMTKRSRMFTFNILHVDKDKCYIKSLNLNSNLSITIAINKFEFRFKLLM